jgi:hypothetical protein
MFVVVPRVTIAQASGPEKSPAPESTPEADKNAAQDKTETKPPCATTTKLRLSVIADEKPVGNASVYVKYNERSGILHREKLAEMNFKTNQDGTVKVPEVPCGKILIQVVAKGWHTFGQWYTIDTDYPTIQIKLEPPPHWY